MRNDAPLLWRTAENVAAVRKLRAEGLTYPEIGKRLGVSAGVVRVANLQGEARTNEHNAETRRAVLMMLESGVPQIEVARHFGVSAFSIRSWRDAPKKSAVRADTAGVGATKFKTYSPAPAAPELPRIVVRIPERIQRMRDSLKARGMSHEMALREAMRICAGSAVEVRGDINSRAAGGACVSPFHVGTMPTGAGD
jgi:transposase